MIKLSDPDESLRFLTADKTPSLPEYGACLLSVPQLLLYLCQFVLLFLRKHPLVSLLDGLPDPLMLIDVKGMPEGDGGKPAVLLGGSRHTFQEGFLCAFKQLFICPPRQDAEFIAADPETCADFAKRCA
jgi:hypothetical protein